jgi:hypothetical protein
MQDINEKGGLFRRQPSGGGKERLAKFILCMYGNNIIKPVKTV